MSLCQLLLNEVLFNADGGIQRPHASLFHKASLLLITIYRPPLSTRATRTNNMLQGRQWGVPCVKNNRMSQTHKSVCVCVINVRQSVCGRKILLTDLRSVSYLTCFAFFPLVSDTFFSRCSCTENQDIRSCTHLLQLRLRLLDKDNFCNFASVHHRSGF